MYLFIWFHWQGKYQYICFIKTLADEIREFLVFPAASLITAVWFLLFSSYSFLCFSPLTAAFSGKSQKKIMGCEIVNFSWWRVFISKLFLFLLKNISFVRRCWIAGMKEKNDGIMASALLSSSRKTCTVAGKRVCMFYSKLGQKWSGHLIW